MRDLVLYELELAGSRASAGEMRRVMPHVADGRMRLREVMTHEFALADFGEALATFRDPAAAPSRSSSSPRRPQLETMTWSFAFDRPPDLRCR